MSPLTPGARRRLEKSARAAARHAYAPYSHFAVGAAVLGGSGRIYAGCNVENASYGLCNCAERSAVFAAVTAGERAIRAVTIYTPTSTPTAPCGACRQVINEFGPEALVISLCDGAAPIASPVSALLPAAFGPQNLTAAHRSPPPAAQSVAKKSRTTARV